MRLAGKIISAFVLASVVPIILMSVLLYLFISGNGEKHYISEADTASAMFRYYYEDEIGRLERRGNELVSNSDFLIDALDLPKREVELTAFLEAHFARDEFQFAVVRMHQPEFSFKAFQGGLEKYLAEFHPNATDDNGDSQSGIVRLSERHAESVAIVSEVPIMFRDAIVGKLMLGIMLPKLVKRFPIDALEVEALLVVAGNEIIFARSSDSLLNDNLAKIAAVQAEENTWRASVDDREFLVRESELIGLNGQTVASMKLLFDLSGLQAERRDIVKVFLGLAVAAVILALIMGFFYQRSLSRPISELADAARKIASGNDPKRIHYYSDDEIGDLVSGMNRLSDDLHETQQRLVRAEQVAAWQMFARQTAHEIRNFLMPLATTAAQLERWAQAGQLDTEHALAVSSAVQSEIHRMKTLLASFSDFAKMPSPTLKKLNPRTVTDELKTAFADEVRLGRLHLSVDSELSDINCDPEQIRQVLINLLKNSLEAGATLVEVRVSQNDRKTLFEVCDDGKGIDLSKGIDPFTPLFSTKETGSGLGLAICKRIIIDHGGDINFINKPTGGTTFTFYLPMEIT